MIDIVIKGKSMSVESETPGSEVATGLGILLVAQFLSAFMGAYVEETYAKHGANWVESLFYTHFLSLPLFLPISASIRRDYGRLAATPPLDMSKILSNQYFPINKDNPIIEALSSTLAGVPQGLLSLAINTATQLACISGVNLLSAKSSAVTVTIVLNIRKLVSFIFSTILFGHQLTGKMVFGSTLVFGSGALYGWETSWRLPQQRKYEQKQKGQVNGSVEKQE